MKYKHNVRHKAAAITITAALLLGTAAVLPAQTIHAAQSAEVTWGVNMRTAPSSSSNVIRMLKKGESITIIAEEGTSWYKVSDANGRTGYISSSAKYTSVTGGSSSAGSSSGSAAAVPALNATVKKSVSFREGASTSADRIRYLKAGEKVQVLGKSGSSWYEVIDANGVKGYVTTQAQYMTLNSSSSSASGSTSSGTASSSGSTNTSGSSSPTGSTSQTNASVEKVIAAGMKYLGTPYEYGSSRNTTTTFDCSDFVRQAFKDGLGITLPADSRKQGTYVKDKGNKTADISKLKRGDLMFFMSYKGSSASSYKSVNKSTATITHVGIYLGEGKILHTYSKDSGGVRTNTISGTHWEHRFLFGGSAL